MNIKNDIPAIELVAVSKSFGNIQANKDISVRVMPGTIHGIIGENGAGKSTLMSILYGFYKADKGEVFIAGNQTQIPDSQAAIAAGIGMVFQHFNLFPHLTVLENCTLAPIWVRKTPKREAEEIAMHFLKKVKIPDQANKYPGQLSGGQQQRVAIARSLCMRPRIMLFDEPTSALDPEMIAGVLDVMVQLADEGMTMICVTHEMGFARKIADRIVFMDEGEIIEIATPAVFFSAPESERAKLFLSQVLGH